MTADSIARLKITLDDTEPQVLRRIDVPLSMRLDRLHLTLQAAMGWTNSHLWEIRARDIGWGPHQLDYGFGDGPLNAAKATLLDVLEDTGVKKLTYLYDFGDGWEHTIRIERILDAAPDGAYPQLIEAKGACPPEDIGGPWGYGEFLEVIADPKHERYAELTEWHDPDFDPAAVEPKAIAAALSVLAKRWSRKPAARKKKAA